MSPESQLYKLQNRTPLTDRIQLWSTFIYCPLAHMVWSDTGFLGNMGVLDFAGGTPVHIVRNRGAQKFLFEKLNVSRFSRDMSLSSPQNSLCERDNR